MLIRTFRHLYVWNNKKKFSSFVENELALFVGNIPTINEFLDTHFYPTSKVLDTMEGLSLWVKIFQFMGITHLQSMTESEYRIKLNNFKHNVEDFYDVGSRSFLSLSGNIGSEETFYMHTLRYYMPRVAEDCLEKHNVGVGVFTMQGFERRNKESKNCMKRFSNHKGNIVVNNLKRVWDIFENNTNNY